MKMEKSQWILIGEKNGVAEIHQHYIKMILPSVNHGLLLLGKEMAKIRILTKLKMNIANRVAMKS